MFRKKQDTGGIWQKTRRSPVLEEKWIDGRRRVAGVPYMLPNDTQEVNRLDFQHYMLRYVLQGNYLAPIGYPANILDVGCGTARWMADMAIAFPRAKVTGVDITLSAATEQGQSNFPRNCILQQGNVLEGLPFADKSFDFVHQRLLSFGIPENRWPLALRELARVTQPGGWVELVEGDIILENPGPESARVSKWITTMCAQRHINPLTSRKLSPLLQAAGLVNITSRSVTIPLGERGGRLGKMAVTDFLAFSQAIKSLITATVGVTSQEYDETLEASTREHDSYQSSCSFHFAYGQRPK